MSRTLLLCFIHGFKGDDDTFQNFPADLKTSVAKLLPDHAVHSVVYPKYETKGELAQCTGAFLAWLKERVMELRRERSDAPWPPKDRHVSVVLVAHSMGGFIASDTLFLVLDEWKAAREGQDADPNPPPFPLIQGVLAFDTPYNGLARSMFVYGAFSNYSKVSSVFNVMTALAAAPAGLSRMAMQRAATVLSPAAAAPRRSPAWRAWQLMAVRTGTVGAIAAGGVAAYVHRRQIAAGLRSVRALDRAALADGYQRGLSSLGQGLAYINRGNVGRSYAWLAEHFTFVGALLKPRELDRRLARLAALRGVGVADVYASLGENGYWSGGYFVPERTFCAVPLPPDPADADAAAPPAAALFSRHVVARATDEVDAHMAMFKPDKNPAYADMTDDAAARVAAWFNSEEDVFDDPRFATDPATTAAATAADDANDSGEQDGDRDGPAHGEREEEDKITATDEGVAVRADTAARSPSPSEAARRGEKRKAEGDPEVEEEDNDEDDDALLDESPIDIAAAASLVPLPDDGEGQAPLPDARARQRYLRHLFAVAEQAGTGLRSYTTTWSAKLPAMPAMPSMESMPGLPSIPRPGFGLFSKKQAAGEKPAAEDEPAAEARGAQDANEAAAPSNDIAEKTELDETDKAA